MGLSRFSRISNVITLLYIINHITLFLYMDNELFRSYMRYNYSSTYNHLRVLLRYMIIRKSIRINLQVTNATYTKCFINIIVAYTICLY